MIINYMERTGIAGLPEIPLETTIGKIPADTLYDIEAKIRAAGVDPFFVRQAGGYREVIYDLIKLRDPDFDEDF